MAIRLCSKSAQTSPTVCFSQRRYRKRRLSPSYPKREEFERLAKEALDSIQRNDPESGLDRLHTFAIAFTRSLCEKRGIKVERDKPLHSIFGEYVKKLKELKLIESQMTERILKSSR